jgi:hypothetical protein
MSDISKTIAEYLFAINDKAEFTATIDSLRASTLGCLARDLNLVDSMESQESNKIVNHAFDSIAKWLSSITLVRGNNIGFGVPYIEGSTPIRLGKLSAPTQKIQDLLKISTKIGSAGRLYDYRIGEKFAFCKAFFEGNKYRGLSWDRYCGDYFKLSPPAVSSYMKYYEFCREFKRFLYADVSRTTLLSKIKVIKEFFDSDPIDNHERYTPKFWKTIPEDYIKPDAIESVFPIRTETVQCEVCGEGFVDCAGLRRHITIKHQNESKKRKLATPNEDTELTLPTPVIENALSFANNEDIENALPFANNEDIENALPFADEENMSIG